MPQDPASGAARSLKTISEMLFDAGFQVRALGTTASESGTRSDAVSFLKSTGLTIASERSRAKHAHRPEHHFQQRGISYRLLDVAGKTFVQWPTLYGKQFDLMFDDELDHFDPDIIFTFGARKDDVNRHHRAQRRGCRIVFGLRNLAYQIPGCLDHVDAILTPSQFLTDRYRSSIGLESTPLPTPLELEDVIADERHAIFVTMVNPSVAKGVMLFARLAEEVSLRNPQIAFLVIESRGTGGVLVRAGLAGGFDLRRHDNIMISGAVPKPKDIYDPTRVLLVPSLIEEASGRVIPEAMVNGIPPIVSDRGGMPEAVNGGGFVVPVPSEITPQTLQPVSVQVVEPWVELILKLAADEEFYTASVEKARTAARAYSRDVLAPQYVAFFENALR